MSQGVSDCEEPWSVDADAAVEDVSSGSTVSFGTSVRSSLIISPQIEVLGNV